MVSIGDANATCRHARALAGSLRRAGLDAVYVGHETSARRIAASATGAGADAIELCVASPAAMRVVRELLRELKALDRGDLNLVVHKVH